MTVAISAMSGKHQQSLMPQHVVDETKSNYGEKGQYDSCSGHKITVVARRKNKEDKNIERGPGQMGNGASSSKTETIVHVERIRRKAGTSEKLGVQTGGI